MIKGVLEQPTGTCYDDGNGETSTLMEILLLAAAVLL